MKHKRAWIRLAVLLFPVLLLSGCVIHQGTDKVQDLEFTVADVRELPKALQEQLELKKEGEFKITYSDNEYLYIARGYGMRETGGYSIAVNECSLTENAILVKTTLTGPQVGENVEKTPSYPYIVIKLELRSEPVVFE